MTSPASFATLGAVSWQAYPGFLGLPCAGSHRAHNMDRLTPGESGKRGPCQRGRARKRSGFHARGYFPFYPPKTRSASRSSAQQLQAACRELKPSPRCLGDRQRQTDFSYVLQDVVLEVLGHFHASARSSTKKQPPIPPRNGLFRLRSEVLCTEQAFPEIFEP